MKKFVAMTIKNPQTLGQNGGNIVSASAFARFVGDIHFAREKFPVLV